MGELMFTLVHLGMTTLALVVAMSLEFWRLPSILGCLIAWVLGSAWVALMMVLCSSS